LPGRAGANIAAFVAKIDVLREQTADMNLRDIMATMLDYSGLLTHYRAEREGEDRLENLEELLSAAESFVLQEGFGRDAAGLTPAVLSQSPASQGLDPNLGGQVEPNPPDFDETGETLSPLVAFLTHAALEAGDNMAQAGQDAVQLMTVHAAKGLEFDAVFITGLEEGLFPNENALSDRDGLEEERRLMYVAITRARQRLYMTFSQTRMLHGQTRYNLRSRFFDELPDENLKFLTPPRAPARSSFGNSWGAGTRDASAAPAWSTSAAAPVAQKEPAAHGLRLAQKVFHNKFGEGTILTLEGSGDDARAQISFPRHGTKWLALSVAKLTPV
jgi:DNA helicase-2/ATP-dependent DNA helicase PcrA